MSILGIGVDLVYSPRIASLLNRRKPGRLASRILSLEEIFHWEALQASDDACRVRFLAVRWAVKEAAYKAMYPIVVPTWKELTYRGLGEASNVWKPELVYTPVLPEEGKKVGKMHVSVSHDGEYVFTSVLVEDAPRIL